MNEGAPTGLERPLESLDDYWHLCAERLKSAEQGSVEHRIANRNYWIVVLSMARQLPTIGSTSLGRAHAFNTFYAAGLESEESFNFTADDIRHYERIIYSNIEAERRQPLPVDAMELLQGLFDGTYKHQCDEFE